MSPLPLRRYRAERLLREQFEQQRRNVVGGVASRLRAVGVQLDERDIESCYAQAWQGLYASVLDGEEVANPSAWLALVTYRRALDEHRSRIRIARLALDSTDHDGVGGERDLVDELDDRIRLRQLFEGLRARLNARERQAAALCYLQGLSRADAAERMGVSQARMRKLMEGRGSGSPGVAGKVGALVETIVAGRWCEEQGSLMRGFAYGILDPSGERHELAELHYGECPACRAYVLSLRGLAAALPPLPSTLALLLGSSGAGGAAGSAATAAGGAAPTGPALATSALSASGAAGVSTAGGGWWLAGSLGAKLAAGCLLALGVGVGAGCVALSGHAGDRGSASHRHRRRSALARAAAATRADPSAAISSAFADRPPSRGSAGTTATRASPAPAPAERAAREFGPEQPASAGGASASTAAERTLAHAASTRPASGGGEPVAPRAPASGDAGPDRAASSGAPAAEREFAPG